MTISPIELMIDKVTGYVPGKIHPVKYNPVRCDNCRRHKAVLVSDTKPTKILCKKCVEDQL